MLEVMLSFCKLSAPGVWFRMKGLVVPEVTSFVNEHRTVEQFALATDSWIREPLSSVTALNERKGGCRFLGTVKPCLLGTPCLTTSGEYFFTGCQLWLKPI